MPFWQRFRHSEETATKTEVPPTKPSKTAAVDSSESVGISLTDSLDKFGFVLLQRECSRRPRENVFISPMSIFLSLAMMEKGAGGETKLALRKALALATETSEQAINDSTVLLMKRLRLQQGGELDIANALWANADFTIAPEFMHVCQEIYDATVRTLDLNQPSSAAVINEWVTEKTRGKISQIVTPAGIVGLPAILTNAVYFKGKFLDPFPKEATQPRTFYLAAGREKLVPMMQKTGLSGAYRSGKKSEAAALHYRNSNIVIFVILPQKGISPEEALTEDFSTLIVEHDVELDLLMPRFRIEFNSGLRESLTSMGIGIAFEYPGADFSGIGSPFYVSDVLHKTLLEVDEEGTVAAAATAAVFLGAALSPREPRRRQLIFDRPFAVLLRDYTSSATLFAGVVYEP